MAADSYWRRARRHARNRRLGGLELRRQCIAEVTAGDSAAAAILVHVAAHPAVSDGAFRAVVLLDAIEHTMGGADGDAEALRRFKKVARDLGVSVKRLTAALAPVVPVLDIARRALAAGGAREQ